MTTEPKHPEIEVEITGTDSNAFHILARVGKAMKKAGVSQGDVDAFLKEATSGDYDHVLQTVMKTVHVT